MNNASHAASRSGSGQRHRFRLKILDGRLNIVGQELRAHMPFTALGTFSGARVFLLLSVWLPCCTSDIVFPLLFAPEAKSLKRPGRLLHAVLHRKPGSCALLPSATRCSCMTRALCGSRWAS